MVQVAGELHPAAAGRCRSNRLLSETCSVLSEKVTQFAVKVVSFTGHCDMWTIWNMEEASFRETTDVLCLENNFMRAFSGPEGVQVPIQRITAVTEYTEHPVRLNMTNNNP